MIYKGTNYTERINFATYEGQKFWTELRKEPTTPKLEVFLCEDMGTSRDGRGFDLELEPNGQRRRPCVYLGRSLLG